MNLNDLINLDYSFYILVCAVFFPIVAAIAVFICLRRAGTVRKILGYFIPMPMYVAICIFGVPGITSLLHTALDITIHQPKVTGFLAVLTVGIIYLGIVSLICGKDTKKRGGRVLCGIFTVICAALCGSMTVMQQICYTADIVVVPELADRAPVFTLGEVMGHFGINVSCGAGLDIIALALLAVYIVVYFLSFIGSAERFADEDGIASMRRKRGSYDPAVEPLCAVCEYARPLKDSPGCVLCDKIGVVSEDHTCRRFVYDPLKRRPARIPLPDGSDNEK